MKAEHCSPCADCQKAMHGHASLEYIYCGHRRVVMFRLADGSLDCIEVESTADAIEIVAESGCQSIPQTFCA